MIAAAFALQVAVVSAFVQLEVHKVDTPQILAKRDSGDLALHELPLQNAISFYQTEISIGTPPQFITVQLDTGSSDLWIISSDNPYSKERKSPDRTVFDKHLSKSLRLNSSAPPFNIAYGDFTYASGIYAQDDILLRGFRHGITDNYIAKLGSGLSGSESEDKHHTESDFLTIKGANFAIADKGNSSEAVWGIGMVSTESITRNLDANGEPYPAYENIPVQMKSQGYIDRLAYSLWLNDLHSTVGSILFGAVDRAKFIGDLQRVPMVEGLTSSDGATDFSVMLHGISAFNREKTAENIISCSIPVLLDSGTSYSQLPSSMLDTIAQTLGAVLEPTHKVYVVSESRKKELNGGGLKFNLSNIEIEVSVDELLLPIGTLNGMPEEKEVEYIGLDDNPPSRTSNSAKVQEDVFRTNHLESYYLLGIFPVIEGSPNAYILGDTFLRSTYVTYDLEAKEIALANTNYNATDARVEKLGSDGLLQFKAADLYNSTSVTDEFFVNPKATEVFIGCKESKSHCSATPNLTTSDQTSAPLTRFLSRPTSASETAKMTLPPTHKLRMSHQKHQNGAVSLNCNLPIPKILIAMMVLYMSALF